MPGIWHYVRRTDTFNWENMILVAMQVEDLLRLPIVSPIYYLVDGPSEILWIDMISEMICNLFLFFGFDTQKIVLNWSEHL